MAHDRTNIRSLLNDEEHTKTEESRKTISEVANDNVSKNASPKSVLNNEKPKTDIETSVQKDDTKVAKSSTPSKNSKRRGKRKAFSHRSKTGCLTCRRRRIKCDECKPFCQNCIRSHRICSGYAHVYAMLKNKYGESLEQQTFTVPDDPSKVYIPVQQSPVRLVTSTIVPNPEAYQYQQQPQFYYDVSGYPVPQVPQYPISFHYMPVAKPTSNYVAGEPISNGSYVDSMTILPQLYGQFPQQTTQLRPVQSSGPQIRQYSLAGSMRPRI